MVKYTFGPFPKQILSIGGALLGSWILGKGGLWIGKLALLRRAGPVAEVLWVPFRRWVVKSYLGTLILIVIVSHVSGIDTMIMRWAQRTGNTTTIVSADGATVLIPSMSVIVPIFIVQFTVAYTVGCTLGILGSLWDGKGAKNDVTLESELPKGILAMAGKGDWEGVQRVARTLLADTSGPWTPDDLMARVHLLIGCHTEKRGNISEAEEHLEKALELDPSLIAGKYRLGQRCATTGRGSRALELMEACVTQTNDEATYHGAKRALKDLKSVMRVCCPECGNVVVGRSYMLGEEGTCPRCKTTFTLSRAKCRA